MRRDSRRHNLATIDIAYALVPQTDPKNRHLSRKSQDEVAADPGFLWCLRSRRDHDPIRSKLRELFEGDLVVPKHPWAFAKLGIWLAIGGMLTLPYRGPGAAKLVWARTRLMSG